MQAYSVTYDGSYMHGRAVVLANSESEAIELVRTHKGTTNFVKVRCEVIPTEPDKPAVLENWDGDY